jgi:hypothetical protein
MTSRLVPFVTVAALLLGCGGGHAKDRALAAVAHKCHEPKAVVSAYVDSMLRSARTDGVRGTRSEALRGLSTLTSYSEERKEAVDCRGLLAALIASAQKHPK